MEQISTLRLLGVLVVRLARLWARVVALALIVAVTLGLLAAALHVSRNAIESPLRAELSEQRRECRRLQRLLQAAESQVGTLEDQVASVPEQRKDARQAVGDLCIKIREGDKMGGILGAFRYEEVDRVISLLKDERQRPSQQ